jgi:outer membrane protein TolC
MSACSGKASSIASSSKTLEGAPKRLTLKGAESTALRNAPVLGSAFFNAQAAKDVVKEVRSQFFPQVEGVIEHDFCGLGLGTNCTHGSALISSCLSLRI